MFELFNPREEYIMRAGALPHWYQPGVTYFVTFRSEDSVPQSLVRSWHRKRDDWLARRGIDPRAADWKQQLRAEPAWERGYHTTFTRPYMEYLDRGYGECVLRDPSLAKIVGDSLLHFDGERYLLGDFVVMPNHVHVLVCLLETTEIEALCTSWK